MAVFPHDGELAYCFQLENPETSYGFDEEMKEQIEFYNCQVIDPFFSQILGFKLKDIQQSIAYVAQFFAIPFDITS